MLANVWTWLQVPANQHVLTWLGGGVAVVVSGLWAVVRFFVKPEGKADKPTIVRANNGIAAGRDISGNTINIGPSQEKVARKPEPGAR